MIPKGKGYGQYDSGSVSDLTGIDTGDETLVQQHLKDEVDINTIVRRFGLTDALPKWRMDGMYGDFTGVSDYESAVEKVKYTEQAFMSLPAEVRDRFKNDPGELVRFAESVPEAEFNALFNPPADAPPPDVPPEA